MTADWNEAEISFIIFDFAFLILHLSTSRRTADFKPENEKLYLSWVLQDHTSPKYTQAKSVLLSNTKLKRPLSPQDIKLLMKFKKSGKSLEKDKAIVLLMANERCLVINILNHITHSRATVYRWIKKLDGKRISSG